jgi:hypothetical protein
VAEDPAAGVAASGTAMGHDEIQSGHGAGESPPQVGQMCEELFAAKSGGLDATRIFQDKYCGRHIKWSGHLLKVEQSGFDLVFGFEPCGKATFRIHQLASALSASRDVLAVVQIPLSDVQRLEHLTGEQLAFEGELAACDHVSYAVLVRHGTIVD